MLCFFNFFFVYVNTGLETEFSKQCYESPPPKKKRGKTYQSTRVVFLFKTLHKKNIDVSFCSFINIKILLFFFWLFANKSCFFMKPKKGCSSCYETGCKPFWLSLNCFPLFSSFYLFFPSFLHSFFLSFFLLV